MRLDINYEYNVSIIIMNLPSPQHEKLKSKGQRNIMF